MDTVKANVNTLGLPSPRLQLRWEKTGETWEDRVCHYELCFPLSEYDIRREAANGERLHTEYVVELGATKVRGGDKSPIHNGKVDTPFRDGVHAMWDGVKLNLRVFAVCDSYFTEVEKTREQG